VILARRLSTPVYSSNLITTGHALQLLRTRKRRDPARTLRSIQLDIWLRIVEVAEVVENTNLDHFVVAERRGLAPHVGATVSAERSGHIRAGISCLRPRFGLSRDDLEAFAGRDDVGAVGGAAHLLAVETVAQGLGGSLVSAHHAITTQLLTCFTYLCCRLSSELNADIAARASSFRHFGTCELCVDWVKGIWKTTTMKEPEWLAATYNSPFRKINTSLLLAEPLFAPFFGGVDNDVIVC
jgi:hypothetical protein